MAKAPVYSLKDVITTYSHPDVGSLCLSENGGGRISFNRSGDMSSHTVSATGDVVINRLVSKNGTINLEIPTNSVSDKFLDKCVKYLASDKCPSDRYALSTLTIRDRARGTMSTFTGVTFQKKPDRTYESTSPNMQYALLYAEEIEGAI